MSFFQVNNRCNGCLACVQNCPACALAYEDEGEERKLLHNMTLCARCGQCWRVCPEDAIEFRHLLQGDWDTVATLDIILCRMCGEPVYTTAFGAKVAEKIDEEIIELCPRHRQRFSLSVWPQLFPRNVKTGGLKK